MLRDNFMDFLDHFKDPRATLFYVKNPIFSYCSNRPILQKKCFSWTRSMSDNQVTVMEEGQEITV